ncbi:hypothetical protein ILUMI_15728 [Ignelater luminosus]|uniref:Uncharacterized protein n=1 Tax=Ignelater luminosus TaxID=2038154 RepID=A0A8K0G3L0_IGNLU|nr:hypothetical protein ILUMI_15728 [Ignelater luminosus]
MVRTYKKRTDRAAISGDDISAAIDDVLKGYKKCGIVPFDKSVFTTADFSAAIATNSMPSASQGGTQSVQEIEDISNGVISIQTKTKRMNKQQTSSTSSCDHDCTDSTDDRIIYNEDESNCLSEIHEQNLGNKFIDSLLDPETKLPNIVPDH